MGIKYKHQRIEHSREDNIKEYIGSLESGKIFYDLGSNLGWFTLYAASLGLKTYSFEVDKMNYLGLVENVDMNPDLIKNIRIFNKGIADRKRVLNLRKMSDSIGEHLKTLEIDTFCGSPLIISNNIIEEVEVDSLDNFILENSLPYPDHLKVDIDGSEYSFLLGAKKSLENARSMVIEFYTESEYFEKCISILDSLGFKMVTKYEIPLEENLFNFVFSKDVE